MSSKTPTEMLLSILEPLKSLETLAESQEDLPIRARLLIADFAGCIRGICDGRIERGTSRVRDGILETAKLIEEMSISAGHWREFADTLAELMSVASVLGITVEGNPMPPWPQKHALSEVPPGRRWTGDIGVP